MDFRMVLLSAGTLDLLAAADNLEPLPRCERGKRVCVRYLSIIATKSQRAAFLQLEPGYKAVWCHERISKNRNR